MSSPQRPPSPPAQGGGQAAPPQGGGEQTGGAQLSPEQAGDPAFVWRTLQQRLADRPSLAFIDHLQLAALTQQKATLAPVPGRREMASFCTPERLAPVAAELADMLGRRVVIEVQTGPGTGGGSDRSAGRPGGRSASLEDRQAAMGLPLVKQLLEQFPDASLVGVSDEVLPPPPAPESDDAGDEAANDPSVADDADADDSD